MGDQVIVETAQGPEFATCTEGNHEVEDSAIVKTLSPMLRLATDSDRRTVEQNKKRESEAFDICEKKIAAHGLEMKLVNVSASFDGSKIVFYFTADGRVDFRELVRDLAGVFRARIELRQIGVRDEAKMIGGLGICGRPFCCSQFLDGFLPVSIKMAKTQNLSLNPAKISGTCGRLMCCLKYEQNVYEDASKRMPKVESFVQTPDGPGNVKSVDLLRETVKVSLDSAPEPLKCYHNCEICVLRNGKGSREGIAIPERPARYVEETGRGRAAGGPDPHHAVLYGCPAGGCTHPGEDRRPRQRREASPAAGTGAAAAGAARARRTPSSPRQRPSGRSRRSPSPGPPGRRASPPSRSRQRGSPPPPAERERPSAAAGPITGVAAGGTRTAARAALPPRANKRPGERQRLSPFFRKNKEETPMGRFDGVLLASDFDNTLIYTEDALLRGEPIPPLPERNRQALTYFMAEGGRFAISTGRALAAFEKYAPLVPMNAPGVICNGAALYDFAKQEYLVSALLDENARQRGQLVLDRFPEAAVEAYHIGNVIHAVHPNAITRHHEHLTKVAVTEAPSLLDVPLPLGKLLFEASHETLEQIRDFLLAQGWGEDYELIFSGQNLLEMTAHGANKGGMVRRLAEHLGIRPGGRLLRGGRGQRPAHAAAGRRRASPRPTASPPCGRAAPPSSPMRWTAPWRTWWRSWRKSTAEMPAATCGSGTSRSGCWRRTAASGILSV